MLSVINSSKHREDGFTLIELLIVVIIIGILAAIALPIFIDQQKVAVDASVQSDVRNSVTNITNAQAQNALTDVKAAVTNDGTTLRLTSPAVGAAAAIDSSATKATGSKFANVPTLGSAYVLAGQNDGGKKFTAATGKAFTFTAATGRFTTENTAAGSGGSSGSGGGGGNTQVTDSTHFVTPALSVGATSKGPSYISTGNDGLRFINEGTGAFRQQTTEVDGQELVSSDAILNGAEPSATADAYTGAITNVKVHTTSGTVLASTFSGCTYRVQYETAQSLSNGGLSAQTGGKAAYYAQIRCDAGGITDSNEGLGFTAGGGYITFDSAANNDYPGQLATGSSKFTLPAGLITAS